MFGGDHDTESLTGTAGAKTTEQERNSNHDHLIGFVAARRLADFGPLLA